MDFGGIARHEPATVEGAERRAAVIAPIITRDGEDGAQSAPGTSHGDQQCEHHILFTKRADHLGEHPGQMSWPGGGHEPSDDDLTETARREGHEEIGLCPDEVDIVGRLDDIYTVTDYAVRPFVAHIPDRAYTPNEHEVAEIVVLAVSDLIDPDNYEWERRDHPHYGEMRLDFFHVDGYTVWGATGRMLAQLLRLTTDWIPPAEPEYVVDPDTDLPT